MQRVVLDTNVILSAMLTRFGPAAITLGLALNRRLLPVLNEEILEEYHEVLSRPKFNLDRRDIQIVLEWLRRVGHVHPGQALPGGRKGFPDPSDVVFLEVAVGGKVDALITRNCKHFPADRRCGIRVVTPEELVGIIGL